ncbi:MAG: phosphotransferase [Bacteroidaceae bacterium]|nr:phosphotransferase [Bacteroidaceae bacterium]
MDESFEIKIEGTTIRLKGNLDGKNASALEGAMRNDAIYMIDFTDVEDVNFAALRALLNLRKSGLHFSVVNANSEVAEKFEDTGVSAFVPVCRKPKHLDMSKYIEFGASFLSKAYNSADGDAMIKVYSERTPHEVVMREKAVAKAVMLFGIPTPLVGTLYQDGESMGLDFERIEGKRSFSRIISEEPERLEEMTVRFAKMCKELHSKLCDTTVFTNKKMIYRPAILACKDITEEERQKALDFLDNVPNSTTCLHGDMQLSNVITNGKEDLWIDLSDFSYGCPMFDMGMWYFLSQLNPEHLMINLFHFGKKEMDQVWPIFVREYFGAKTEAEQAEVRKQVEPFAALHMLFLGATYGFEPGMLDFIKAKLLN